MTVSAIELGIPTQRSQEAVERVLQQLAERAIQGGSVEPLILLDSDDDEAVQPWQEEALCAQVDPDAFFPEKGDSNKAAKKVCGRCDVSGDCLSYALAQGERFGIWGGLSDIERRRLQRRKAS